MVVVSSLTTLDNKCSLLFTNDYVLKKGKTRDDMKNNFAK